MMRYLKECIGTNINRVFPHLSSRLECKFQKFSGFNERAVEFLFVFKHLARLYPKSVLDVGTGTSALPSLIRKCGCLVKASDNVRDFWPSGMVNRHYSVMDDDITDTRIKETFDLITCVSVLEHVTNHDAAVRNMLRLLNPNGHVILTFPYNEKKYVGNVYELPGSNAYGKSLPYICQSYSREQLDTWIRANDAAILDQEYWRFWEGGFWSVGSQTIPPVRTVSGEPHQLSCLLISKLP